MNDLIRRQETIRAMENVDWYHISKDGQLTHGANSEEHEPLYKAKDVYKVLNDMPSAQPEKRTEERTETHGVCLDAIDRQAAIDAVADLYWMDERLLNFKKEIDATFDKIIALPSAQPERRWIPCSERLPEEDTDVLVTYVNGEEARIAPVNYGHGTWFDCVFDTILDPLKVTAWMPLPELQEPYKEGGAV